MLRGSLQEGLRVTVAADHLVQRHDVRRGNARRKVHEVAVDVRDAAMEAVASGLSLRYFEKSAGGVHVSGLPSAGFQKRQMDGPDAAAHLKNGPTLNAQRQELLDEHPRGSSGTALAVMFQLILRVVTVEHLFDAGAMFAAHLALEYGFQ